MADNVTADPGAGGSVFASDDIAGVQYPRTKVTWGPDGTANDADVASGKPLPVQLRSSGGTELGTAGNPVAINDASGSITVDAASLPLPTGASTETTLSALNTKVATAKTADLDSGAGTDTVQLIGLALPASGGAVAGGTSTNPVRTDPTGTTTQPVSGTVTANAGSGTLAVSAASLPLPSGASTAAKQPALGTAGAASADVISVQGIASMTALLVDGSAVTQPVSAASLPLPTGAATAARQDTGNTSLGTIAGAVSGTEMQVDVVAPLPAGTNNIGDVDVLSLPALPAGTNNIGDVDIASIAAGDNNIGNVDVVTLPALPAGTNNIGDVDVATLPAGSLAAATAKTSDYDTGAGTDTVPMIGIALPASGGAVAGGTSTNPVRTDPTGTTTQPVSGTVTANLAAGANNIGDVDVLTLPALPAGTNNIGDVDILSIAAGDNNIGNVDVVSLPALAAGTNNIGDVDVLSIAAGDNNIGNVDIVTQPARAAATDTIGAALMTNVINNGTTALTPKFVIIDAATSGDNTILAAVTSKKIRVHQLMLVSAGTVTTRFESGAAGTALTGQMNLVANTGFVLPFSPMGWFETASNTLLNLELSAAISVDGVLGYTEV